MKDTKEGLPCKPTAQVQTLLLKNKRNKKLKNITNKKKKDKENLIGIVCHINQLTNKSNSQHAVPQKTQFSGDCRV